jgi:hypothetical protein
MSKMSALTNDMPRYRYCHKSGDAGAIIITGEIVISGIVIAKKAAVVGGAVGGATVG